ncbi:MAG: laccase [Thermoleophilia bacterium]|nr:laccase [Thermoleophilia bacterium]
MAVADEDDHWTWTAPGAQAVFTTREGGVSPAPLDSLNVGLHVGDDPANVLANRTHAAALLGLDPSHVAGVTQVHGADVWLDLARTDELPREVRWDGGRSSVDADALVTTRAEVALAVGIADCMPIAIVWGPAIAAIHAGWRSLEGGVIEATLAVLRRAAGNAVATDTPHAVIGPALGACCMEVGDDVAARFDAPVVVRRDGAPRPFLDTRADALRRLEAAGCVVEHVDVCTKDDPRCFSHRGDSGLGGRQAMLVRRA